MLTLFQCFPVLRGYPINGEREWKTVKYFDSRSGLAFMFLSEEIIFKKNGLRVKFVRAT